MTSPNTPPLIALEVHNSGLGTNLIRAPERILRVMVGAVIRSIEGSDCDSEPFRAALQERRARKLITAQVEGKSATDEGFRFIGIAAVTPGRVILGGRLVAEEHSSVSIGFVRQQQSSTYAHEPGQQTIAINAQPEVSTHDTASAPHPDVPTALQHTLQRMAEMATLLVPGNDMSQAQQHATLVQVESLGPEWA